MGRGDGIADYFCMLLSTQTKRKKTRSYNLLVVQNLIKISTPIRSGSFERS